MIATLNGLWLPTCFTWPDRERWSDHVEATGRSSAGLLYIEASTRTAGRAVTLTTGNVNGGTAGRLIYADPADATRATITSLRALWDRAPQTMALIIDAGGAGEETHSLRWNRQQPGLGFDWGPLLEYAYGDLPAATPCRATLHLYTVPTT